MFVRIDGSQSRLCYSAAGACTAADAVSSPTGQLPFSVTIPSDVTITAATFQFSALGEYLDSAGGTPGSSLTITVGGDGSYPFTVERFTGYVHP